MIKAELNIDLEQLKAEIVQDVVNSLVPHLKGKEDDDIIFDVEGLAEYLKVKSKWIYAHIKEIPHYKVGKHNRFRKAKIDTWLLTKEKDIGNITGKKTPNSVRRLLEAVP